MEASYQLELRYRSQSVRRLASTAATKAMLQTTKAANKAGLLERGAPFTSRDTKATLLARLEACS